MKASYTEKFIVNGKSIEKGFKTVTLPFDAVSARALIVRRADGALLGTLHRAGGMFALPGGAVDDSESASQAVLRELEEENIRLIGSDEGWRERIYVDYFPGYHELSLWFLFIVDDAEVGECDENIETRWIDQREDRWYPFMRQKIILTLSTLAPDLLQE